MRLFVLIWAAWAFAPAHAANGGRPDGPFRIGAEDVLFITVWKNEAMSRSVAVRPDGMISLPLINDVQAAGLTPTELRQVLGDKLREHLADPEVSVIVTEIRSRIVTVMGEVVKPDRYPIQGRATVVDLLARAGGFTQQAARSRIVVLRREGATVRAIPFDYNRLISSGAGAGDFVLEPGDTILVP
jgi:polysaccharide export outer membrane protein